MTEVVVRTGESPPVIDDIMHDVATNHENRIADLETGDVSQDVADSIAMDELRTTVRDLQTKMEGLLTSNVQTGLSPDIPPDDEPEQPAIDVPDEIPDVIEEPVEDAPDEVPDVDVPSGNPYEDPEGNPHLNPQGEVTEIEKEVSTPEVTKKTTVRKKPTEKIPVQKKRFADFVLGGSGGVRRNQRKLKAK